MEAKGGILSEMCRIFYRSDLDCFWIFGRPMQAFSTYCIKFH